MITHGGKRWFIGGVRIDFDSQPRWWREIGWHFTSERGDERWHDIRMIQVHAWRWSLAVTW